MHTKTQTETATQGSAAFEANDPYPTLLLPYARPGTCAMDRCLVRVPFVVGRSTGSDLAIADDKVSKSHFTIEKNGDHFRIRDLGSRNGTYLDGERLENPATLGSSSLIRVGRTLLVFHRDGRFFLEPIPKETYGMAGKFHLAPLIFDLAEAAKSKRHLLLAGPSGAGKELAAKAIAKIRSPGKRNVKVVVHNAARFSSEEEATSTLFGVGENVFSQVDARMGLIEQAKGGTLFLDETHNLPHRVQRTLLRIIEEGLHSRIGDNKPQPVDVQFVFASNLEGPTHGLAKDLFARLRCVRIQSLLERRADIPEIFTVVLRTRFQEGGLDPEPLLSLLSSEHYEMLCLHGFPNNNVRGLIDLADRLATRIERTGDPKAAVSTVFSEQVKMLRLIKKKSTESLIIKEMKRETRPSTVGEVQQEPQSIETISNHDDITEEYESVGNDESANSPYEQHKDLIISIYRDKESNVAATERALRNKGISCSRRWLSIYLKRWGVKE